MREKFPLVDVIVLNHNGKAFLDACLSSVLASTYPNFRVHLLDNASTHDDVAYAAANYPSVHIIRNLLNNGYCAAYNLAFSKCEGAYFLCLNNDVVVAADWLDHLIEAAESDPGIGALQPKVIAMLDETHFEYAGAAGGMMDMYGFPFMRGRIFYTVEPDRKQYDSPAKIFWTSGAAMLVRASALMDTGMLDEHIVHHMDEIDLNWRMQLQGYHLAIVPSAVIKHYGGATIRAESFSKMYWNHRNSLYIMLKNYEFGNAIRKTFVHLLLDYVAIVVSLFRGEANRSGAILKSHFWIITHLGLIIRKRREVQKKRKVSDRQLLSNMYRRSIVWDYFVLGRKRFSDLPSKNLPDSFKSITESKTRNLNEHHYATGEVVSK